MNAEDYRSTDEDGWRWYNRNGKQYLSVTCVKENAVANKSLESWFKNNSANKIKKVSAEASAFGTECHDLFDCIVSGRPVPEEYKQPKYYPVVQTFMRWAQDHKLERLHSEIPLFSDTYGFAGTVDFVGKIDGELVIADWKITKRYNITNGWQLAAYRLAYEETYGVAPGLVGLQINSQTAEPKMFKYQHYEFVEQRYLEALGIFKGLYFHKLDKLKWPWLKHNAMKAYLGLGEDYAG